MASLLKPELFKYHFQSFTALWLPLKVGFTCTLRCIRYVRQMSLIAGLECGLEYGMENGMEQWTYEVAANSCNWHCSIQVELPSVSLRLLCVSLQKLYEQVRHCPPSCFYIQAWYCCWFIIRCFVIVVLQSQTLTWKVRVWLRKTIGMELSSWTKMWWQKLVLDPLVTSSFGLRLCTSILGH